MLFFGHNFRVDPGTDLGADYDWTVGPSISAAGP